MKCTLTALTLALGAFILNPMLACQSSEESDFSFGETEMRAAVTGTYAGTFPNTGETVTVTLKEATASGTSTTQSVRRTQCDIRSFIKPAAACVNETAMSLVGKVSSDGSSVPSDKVSGIFIVGGTELDNGYLELHLDNGGDLRATYDKKTETLVDWTYQDVDSTAEQALSLEREEDN